MEHHFEDLLQEFRVVKVMLALDWQPLNPPHCVTIRVVPLPQPMVPLALQPHDDLHQSHDQHRHRDKVPPLVGSSFEEENDALSLCKQPPRRHEYKLKMDILMYDGRMNIEDVLD